MDENGLGSDEVAELCRLLSRATLDQLYSVTGAVEAAYRERFDEIKPLLNEHGRSPEWFLSHLADGPR